MAHLSSGELLRQEVKAGTDIGKQAADYLRHGDLVPDELIFAMLAEPIIEASRNGGYVLDGFPRNLRQAEAAYELTKQVGGIELRGCHPPRVAGEELRRRLLARARHEGRSDDSEDVVAHRFEVYAAETEPLLTFYRGAHLVLISRRTGRGAGFRRHRRARSNVTWPHHTLSLRRQRRSAT